MKFYYYFHLTKSNFTLLYPNKNYSFKLIFNIFKSNTN